MHVLVAGFLLASSVNHAIAALTSEAQTWANVRVGGESTEYELHSSLTFVLYRRRVYSCAC
jgi:hypothetical protein